MIIPLIWFLTGFIIAGFGHDGLSAREMTMAQCIAIIVLLATGCTGLYRKLDNK